MYSDPPLTKTQSSRQNVSDMSNYSYMYLHSYKTKL